MSEKQTFFLVHDTARQMAVRAVTLAPMGHCVEIKPKTRTTAQNALLWSLLADISKQVDWHGQKLSSEDWKNLFSASLKQQRSVPGIDGGLVVLGQSTSRMTTKEMSDLCELIQAFGAEHEVRFVQQE